jgi:hypothetical protein
MKAGTVPVLYGTVGTYMWLVGELLNRSTKRLQPEAMHSLCAVLSTFLIEPHEQKPLSSARSHPILQWNKHCHKCCVKSTALAAARIGERTCQQMSNPEAAVRHLSRA